MCVCVCVCVRVLLFSMLALFTIQFLSFPFLLCKIAFSMAECQEGKGCILEGLSGVTVIHEDGNIYFRIDGMIRQYLNQ